MQHSKRDTRFYWLLFLLNYPLLSDLIRRFIYYSDMLYVLGDLFVICTIVLSFRRYVGAANLGAGFYFVAVSLFFWGLATAFVHGNPMIAFVGIRAIYMPFLYIFISAYLFRYYQGGMRALTTSVGLWCFIISIVAVAQIVLGRDHAINLLPSEAGASGIGDFTVESEGLGLEYIFRPTSIFLHTGKFGQIIFLLVLYKWLSLYLYPLARTKFLLATIPFDILGVIISGERSTYLFLTLAMLYIFLFYAPLSRASFVRAIALLTIFIVLGAFAWVAYVPDELSDLLVMRYLSAYQDIFLRLNENLINPAAYVLNKYFIVGEGLGFFTLGASKFGGAILYETVSTAGLAENSWLRLTAEMGVLGSTLFAVILILLSRRAIKTHGMPRRDIDLQRKPATVFVVCWLVAMSAWAITHDIFSNSVMMSTGFALSGPAFARWRTSLGRNNSDMYR